MENPKNYPDIAGENHELGYNDMNHIKTFTGGKNE
jgi:hypothetical protein